MPLQLRVPRHAHRSQTHEPASHPARTRRGVAVAVVAALTAGVSILSAPAAQAATPVSQSEGRFLSGSVLGASLADIVSVAPASATNTGGASSVSLNPLSVTALNAVNVDLGGGVNLLGNNGILALGAVNQTAEANPDGSSRSASGAVTDSGAIAVGGSAAFPSDASLNLQSLITPALSSALSALTVSTGALSATANQTTAGTQTGNYQIAGLNLALTSPLVSSLTSNLRTTLTGLQPVVNGLPALIRALPGVGPLATITGLPNLTALVDALGSITTADGSITANLQTGAITVDVAQVLTTAGLDLNNLPPDTELLPYITAALTSQLLPAITSALTGLVTTITNAVNGISVSVLGIPVALAVLAPVLNPVIAQVVAPVNTAISGLGATVITPLAGALSTMVSLAANVQENAAGTFTERALRIGVLPNAGPPVAVVNLSSASVGPNGGPLVAPTAASLTPDQGPTAGGDTVTVTGTGFEAGATSVTIGGNTVPAGAVTVTSATSLTFSTPAHAAGPVDVTVTTAGGTSGPLGYTYVAVPTAASLTPNRGPIAGGDTVTVTGTGFMSARRSVTIGGTTVPAGAVTVTSATSLTFTTPAHAAGPVDVTVTTAGGTSAPLGYTYLAVPTATSLTPNQGPAAGGDTVTVSGTGFVPGATSVTIGGITVPAADVTVTSVTSLTFSTPAHAAGPVDVTVTTAGGTSAPLGYTYLAVPTTASLTPNQGPAAGGDTVTVSGTGFVPGLTVVTIGGVTVPATVATATSLTFVTPAHVPGAVDVTVTTLQGTTSPALTYTYLAPPPVVPTTASLTPNQGPVAGNQIVTVSGTGFVPGATSVTIGGVTVPAADVTVAGPTSLTFATPPHIAGAVDVTVTTAGGTSTPALTYTYVALTPPAPTAGSLSPTQGPTAGGQTVTVTGSGFVAGATSVTIGGITVPAADVTVISPTSLTFATPAHAAGPVDVVVTTVNGSSAPALTYTYVAPTPVPPTTTSLTPDRGPTAGGQTVTVTGTGFVAGLTQVTIGGISVPADVTSPTSLTFVTPAHTAGPVGVVVTTVGGSSTPALPYTYVRAAAVAPTAASLAPNRGPSAGGQTVRITGTGFVAGATSVRIGGVTVGADEVTVTDSTHLSFVTPAHAAGPVNVTVTTSAGTSTPRRYTYVAAAPIRPTASGLTPSSGPTAGGQTVTVTGTHFVPGSTTVTIGGHVIGAQRVTVLSPTTLRFVTPAHADGAVRVTVTTPGGTSGPLAYSYRPDAPVIVSPSDGATGVDPKPVFSGTGQPGAGIDVTAGTTILCTTVVTDAGTWQCVSDESLTAGDHTVRASQTTSGGQSLPSAAVTFGVGGAGDGPLANTGVPSALLLEFAVLLMVAGAGVLLLGRRRKAARG